MELSNGFDPDYADVFKTALMNIESESFRYGYTATAMNYFDYTQVKTDVRLLSNIEKSEVINKQHANC